MRRADSESHSPAADIVGGVTTFVTMAYIVIVNPTILAAPGTGLTFSGVLTATVLVAASMTLLMGLYARLPFAVAPGMGLNAFFAYTLILQQKVPWQTALGVVFWAGVLFLAVSATPLRERIATGIPPSLRTAAAVGIGLLLTLLGLRSAGLVEGDAATLLRMGAIDHRTALLVLGLAIGVVLMRRRNPLAYLTSIGVVTAIAWVFGFAAAPQAIVSAPDFSTVFLRLDVMGALAPALWAPLLSIMFTDLFDSLSTFVGVANAAKLTGPDGQPINIRRGLIVDAWATLGAGLAGTSSGTAYVESIAGIRMGARTGLASVVTALCFLPCFFIGPLVAAIPAYATAPVLVLVGLAMFQTARDMPFDVIEDALPAFVTMTLIPLTLSITQGILWGFLLHVLLYTLVGRWREVRAVLWALAIISAALLALH